MKAIVQDDYGDPGAVLRLAEIETPEPQPGEVLVRVRAAGVDRGVWHIVAGLPFPIRLAGYGFRRPKRATPGMDLAGVVEAIGTDVVDISLGEEVYGSTNGSFADYAAVPVAKLAPKPTRLTFEQAAAVPISGYAALQAVRDRGRVQPGQKVLVLGASGGVGHLAAQIAAAYGAEVTGVCRTDKLDLVRGLGLARVVDHTREDALDGRRAYDVVIDTGGHRRLRDLRRALRKTGRLVIVGSETSGRWLGGTDRQIRAALWSLVSRRTMGSFISRETSSDLLALTGLIEAGSVTPLVDSVLPLADAAAAINRLTSGDARGKIVLTP
ncbi:MAG: NAD(P)-dependent alcohol dehydrogenase [Actinomycetota bacterium]|nr:NAD(P)-dependent alcohol dehydrogenase [Actinomycetota bacterium]